MKHDVNVPVETNDAVITIVARIFNDISYIDSDMLDENIAFMCDSSVPMCYKAVPIELFDQIVDKFWVIYIALLSDERFRNSVYYGFMKQACLYDDVFDVDLNEHKVLDFSKYDHNEYMLFLDRILKSMTFLEKNQDVIDNLVAKLSDEDMLLIGHIVSNFACFIKALSVDAEFRKYIQLNIDTGEYAFSFLTARLREWGY